MIDLFVAVTLTVLFFGVGVGGGIMMCLSFSPIYMLPFSIGNTRYDKGESWDDRDRRVLLTYRIPMAVGGLLLFLVGLTMLAWWTGWTA